MTGQQPGDQDRFVNGDLESGADPAPGDAPAGTDDVPNKETGVGIGAGEASSFEPEEDSAPAIEPD